MWISRLFPKLAPLAEDGGSAGGGTAVLDPKNPKRIKICEGQEGAIPIEVGYVRQGEKVWVAFGESAELTSQINEAVGAGCQIVESIDQLELLEDASGSTYVKDGVWIVEGPAQRSGVRNINKRVYSRKIWERIIADKKSPQQRLIAERGMLGHIEHPKDGRTDGNLGALITISAELREDGVVWAKFELLDTPAGKILQEYTKKKVKWGVSTRGNGTVDDSGEVNESDYILECWDGVMRPSTPGAFPTLAAAPGGKGKAKGVSEDANNDSPGAGGKPAAGVVTEAVKACIAQVEALGKLNYAALDESAQLDAQLKLVNTFMSLGGHVATGAISGTQGGSLAERLTAVMRATAKPAKSLDAAVNEATGSVAGADDKRTEAFNRVIEGLRVRVKEAVSEATKLRAELEEAQAANEEIARERDDFKSANEEWAQTNEALTARLNIATEAITDLTAAAAPSAVDEALNELLADLPELARHRDILQESETPGQLCFALRTSWLLRESRPCPSRPVSTSRSRHPRAPLSRAGTWCRKGFTVAPWSPPAPRSPRRSRWRGLSSGSR